MKGVILVVLIIALLYVLYMLMDDRGCKKMYMYRTGSNNNDTLNEKDTSLEMERAPVYDDTYRINNKMFWMSDYSQPGQDNLPSLNNEIITPYRPVSGKDAMLYLSGVHKISRYCSEKS
jgi:hypothetical protein